MTKGELLAELQRGGIHLNDIAKLLFAHQGFASSEAVSVLETEDLSVGELGHAQGATIVEVFAGAAERWSVTVPDRTRAAFTAAVHGSA
jgi:hypothetical protein